MQEGVVAFASDTPDILPVTGVHLQPVKRQMISEQVVLFFTGDQKNQKAAGPGGAGL